MTRRHVSYPDVPFISRVYDPVAKVLYVNLSADPKGIIVYYQKRNSC